MSINIIVCHDLQGGIGVNNRLLASLPSDLKRFKQLTSNGIVVSGRKTYESIIEQTGSSLKNRTNIVLTHDYKYKTLNPDMDHVYTSIEELLHEYYELAEPNTDLWIIGGSEVYSQFLKYGDKLYKTVIHHTFTEADSFFPMLDSSWKIKEQQFNKKDDRHEYPFTYITYERIKQ